jgi:hypothetical protein
MKLLLCFWCLEVLPVCLCREVKPFLIWFYPPLLDYGVSIHRLVELIVVIPTNPRSSKTESRCSSYGRFGFSCFCLFQGRRLRSRRAGDSGPKCVFAVFCPKIWPRTSVYFSRPKTPAPRDRRLRPKSPAQVSGPQNLEVSLSAEMGPKAF